MSRLGKINFEREEDFVCECGNDSGKSGFQPCDKLGDLMEPMEDWENHYKCMECFTVYTGDSN